MATGTFNGMLCLVSGPGRLQAIEPAHCPELHLNLWEHVDQVSLDIGLLIRRDCPFRKVFFYLPWTAQQDELLDLTQRINSANAVSVIFNESWGVTQRPGSSSVVVVSPTTGEPLFQVVSPINYLGIEGVAEEAHRISFDFETLVRTEIIDAPKVYIRFRIKGVPGHFYSSGHEQGDRGLVSSWTKDEFIDFRLNVRRGAPYDLESQVGRFLSFSKVHLFLMRHRSNELVFQDAAFRACRSLEDEHFWAKYSHVEDNPSADDLRSAKAHMANSLGYQWTKKALETPVHEFGILAKFKRIELSIVVFVIYAVLLGTAGNALWSLVVLIYQAISKTH